MFDYIVIGSGFAGAVIAERIAEIFNKKVLVIERRDHVGGNCYDYFNDEGVLVHKYGPHIFHTNLKHVWEYISNFTDWHYYQHEVKGFIGGKTVPIPFNINTLYGLLPQNHAKVLEKKLIEKFDYGVQIPILKLREVNDKDLKFLADFIYEKVFLNYTKKQWGLKPEDLDPSVTARVPISISKDNRYFTDLYQGLPKEGYAKLFDQMLTNKNIKIMLGTDYVELIDIDYVNEVICFQGEEFKGKLIYTGEIDSFFDYKFGELPYRSLRFEFESFNQEYFQDVGTVNYPNDYDFTRISEFKHMTGQKNPNTTILKEFPRKYYHILDNVPCYPIPIEDSLHVYEKYQNMANNLQNVIFLGRLAEYKYYNMDSVIDRALKVFEEMKS